MIGEVVMDIMYDELSKKKYDSIADRLLNDYDFFITLCGEINRTDTEKQVIKKLVKLIDTY